VEGGAFPITLAHAKELNKKIDEQKAVLILDPKGCS
jgi:hypothetical protein